MKKRNKVRVEKAVDSSSKETIDELLDYCQFNKICRWKNALEVALEAKELAMEINYQEGVALANLEIGYQYWFLDRYNEATFLLEESIFILKDSEHFRQFGRATAVKASIHWSKGDRKLAISEIFNGLSHIRNLGEDTDGLWLEWFLGIFYFDLKDYKNSEIQYSKAIEIIGKLNFATRDAYAYCLIGMGGVLFATNRMKEAYTIFSKAKKYSIENELWMQQARVLHDLGTYFIHHNDTEKAKKNYTESYTIRKKQNTKAALITSILALVEIEVDPFKALSLAYEGLSYAEDQEIPQKIAASHLAISKQLQKLENFEKSHHHLNEANTIEKKFSNYVNSSEIKTLETQNLIDLLERETEILQNQNNQLKEANRIISEQFKKIKKQQKEKDLLMKEIHHRVKNSLQLTTSMIRLQKYKLSDEGAILALDNSIKRVEAIALVHHFLYKDDNTECILLKDYLEQLLHNSLHFSGVEYSLDCINIRVKTKLMTSLALIISELLSNILKYGFDCSVTSKRIDIRVSLDSTKKLTFLIVDNGIGLPEGFNLSNEFSGLGLELINLLAEQINADINCRNLDSGAEFSIMILLS